MLFIGHLPEFDLIAHSPKIKISVKSSKKWISYAMTLLETYPGSST